VSYPLTLPLHGPVCEKLHKRMSRSRVRDVDELKSRLIEEWEHFYQVFIDEATRQWRPSSYSYLYSST